VGAGGFMRRRWLLGVALVLGAVAVAVMEGHFGPSGPAGGASAVPWGHDLPAALSQAGSENKLVMVDFYADWCQWCKRLDQNTFSDADVQRALAAVVAVRLNGEREGRQAAARLGVEGYPTLIFLDPSGAEVGRIPGYMDPGPFLQEFRDILKKA
jgi:thiol:disulfide interchange protein